MPRGENVQSGKQGFQPTHPNHLAGKKGVTAGAGAPATGTSATDASESGLAQVAANWTEQRRPVVRDRQGRTPKQRQYEQDNFRIQESHYTSHPGIFADGLDEQGEPAPQDVYTHINTDTEGPNLLVTHTQWTDGIHTVELRWMDENEMERFAVISQTDDTPNVEQLIADWRANRI